jgi:CRP-like cAMP-binding protein
VGERVDRSCGGGLVHWRDGRRIVEVVSRCDVGRVRSVLAGASEGRARPNSALKQIMAVLQAVEQGCGTSYDVSEYTGLSLKAASAWLTVLVNDGYVRVVGRKKGERGVWTHIHEPTGTLDD